MSSINLATILLVEDEAMIALSEISFLESEGFKVIHVFNAEEGIKILKSNSTPIDLILMDIDLGKNNMAGTDAARIIINEFNAPLVFLSSHIEKEIVKQTEDITSYGYIVKHSGNTVLLASIKMALKLSHAHKELLEKEIKLKKSEESLLQTIQSIGDGFIATDINGKITNINRVAEILCGWNYSEAIGKPLEEVFQIINSKTRKIVQNPAQKVLETGQVVGLANHTILVSKNKTEYQIADTAAPIFDVNRKILGIVIIFSDVTKKYEQEERVSYLANLLDNVEDAIISTDINFQITSWNRSAEKIYGYKKEEVLGKSSTAILKSYFHSVTREQIISIFNETGKWVGEVIHTKKDGSKVFIQSFVSKVYSREGEYIGAVSINRDLTKTRHIEEKLRFQTYALTNVNDAIIITDENLLISQWNKGAENLYNYIEEEVLGKPIDEVCQTDFTIVEQEKIQNEIITNKKWIGELKQKSRNGNDIWVIASVSLIESIEGKIIGGVTVNHNITERKLSDIKLAESQDRLAGIIESAMDGIISINQNQEIILINPTAEKIFGYKKEEILGKSIDILIPIRFHSSHKEHINNFGKGGSTSRSMNALGIVYGVKANGEEFPVEASISQVKIKDEKIFTVIIRDVTDKKKSEIKLIEKERNLVEAQRISKIGSWSWNVVDNKVYWSDEMHNIFMLPKEKFDNSLEASINAFHPEDRNTVIALTEKALAEKKPIPVDLRILLPDGKIRYVHGQGEMIFDGKNNLVSMTGTYQDVTDQKLTELKIQELLTEKEILLKEVHHRIKNNMQSIVGLINVKKNSIKDKEAASILQDTIAQIHAMSLLYDKLYKADDYRDVPANEYLAQLITEIIEVNTTLKKIYLNIHIEHFVLNTKILFPLGIIINEVIANAVKYAFQNTNSPQIDVSMLKTDNTVIRKIKDNGSGFLNDVNNVNTSGFGLKLIQMLSKQIHGNYEFISDNGTLFQCILDLK